MSVDLLKVSDVIPLRLRLIFPFEIFNPMQSVVARQLLEGDENVIIAAPTGSGKTAVHELAILRLLISQPDTSKLKCLLIAPNKALCQQRVRQWRLSFSKIGLSVVELTGDSLSSGLQSIVKENIFVTTPEKWDSLTRSWRNHLYLLGSIDLLLIDEVHHLGENRGAVLETVIVRMRILNETLIEKDKKLGKVRTAMRVVALSATLPNIVDVGKWLQCPSNCTHYFDETFRPVPLTVHIECFPSWKNPFMFEKSLDDKVAEVIRYYSDGKQTLVFCSSKKGTETLSLRLAKEIRISFRPGTQVNLIGDTKLRAASIQGFGFHHAGLSPDDRAVVETLFLSGSIQVLCTTSTLAHGVNLPAHLVIIKGTSMWNGSGKGYERIPRSTIMQMIGRAGRPGFDTTGVAVIMTGSDDREYYEVKELDTVESALPSCLVEAICTEVTQGVISGLGDAIMWLKMTFFHIRVLQNSSFYNVTVASGQSPESAMQSICLRY